MHTHTMDKWRHEHVFLGPRHEEHAARTWTVVAVTSAMMVVEIVAGTLLGSMALVADGWHMATHAGALAIAAFAYHFASRHRDDARFAFGTGKLGDLGGFSSALLLGVVALLVGYESVARFFAPVAIRFDQALIVAVVGLAVNVVCAWLLQVEHDHQHVGETAEHEHEKDHGHDHHTHHDYNLRAAYVHIVADALTSVLAIVALLAGWLLGWTWMDPLMGLVGAALIAVWSVGLIRASGAVLLDTVPSTVLASSVRQCLEQNGDRLSDLHLWRLGPGHLAVVASIVSDAPLPPDTYKTRLAGLAGLSHVTVEVNRCPHAGRAPAC